MTGSEQPPVFERGVLDIAHWGAPVSSTGQALAGPAAGLGGLEEYPSPLLPLVGPGLWAHLLDSVVDDPDFERLMIEASYIKVNPHGSGARGGNQDMDLTKRGLNSKRYLQVDAHGMPVGLGLTEGPVANCSQAHWLIADLLTQYLLADRGYDTNASVAEALAQGMEPVIPPRSHRREPRYYDQDLYQLRHNESTVYRDCTAKPDLGCLSTALVHRDQCL